MDTDDEGRTKGFLSREAEQLRRQIRTEHAAAFTAVENLSEQATRAFYDAELPSSWPTARVAAMGLWLRALSAFQGAFLLLERGMIAEGQTLIRTGADFLFFSAALERDPGVFDRMANNDDRHRLTQANALLKATHLLQLNDAQIQALKGLASQSDKKLLGITSEVAAGIAGLEELYETLFRGLSASAAHPTLNGLGFVLVDGDGGGFAFGPSTEGVEWSLSLLATCLRLAIQKVSELLKSPDH